MEKPSALSPMGWYTQLYVVYRLGGGAGGDSRSDTLVLECHLDTGVYSIGIWFWVNAAMLTVYVSRY